MSTGLDGRISLAFEQHGGRTVAVRTFREGNSRISANQAPPGEAPYYFLIATGGGFTEGEQYGQEIRLGADTHAILTTQTPTYVYKCEHGRTTCLSTKILLQENALLEMYNDEVIPYRHALYRQRTEVELAPGACLICTEGLTGGWSPEDIPFAYTGVDLCLQARREGRLLCNDHLRLVPGEDPMKEMGYLGSCTDYHSVTIFWERADQALVSRLRSAVEDAGFSPENHDLLYGISLLHREGVTLRILSKGGDAGRGLQRAFVAAFREGELHLPPLDLRKRR